MPIFTVRLLEGRTNQQKADLIAAMTEAAVVSLGVPRDTVRVIIHDVPPSNWGRGGKPMDEEA